MIGVVAMVVLATAACAPYVVPPLRVGVGGGGTLGPLTAPPQESEEAPPGVARPQEVEEVSELGAVQLRVALSPLSLFPSLSARRLDLDLGYMGEFYLAEEVDDFASWGPFFRVRFYPWVARFGRTSILRVGVAGVAELLYNDVASGQQGGGVALELSVEIVGFSDGPYKDRRCSGTSYGETGVGLFLSGGYRALDRRDYGVIVAGLSLSVPASVGVCFKHPVNDPDEYEEHDEHEEH